MTTPELIPNWKQAYKLSSVQLGTAVAVVAAADQWLPGLSGFLPPGVYAVLSALIVIARLIAQPKQAASASRVND